MSEETEVNYSSALLPW